MCRQESEDNRAVAGFSEAIKLDSNDVDAYNDCAFASNALGRKADAIADFRDAQSIERTDQVNRDRLRHLGA